MGSCRVWPGGRRAAPNVPISAVIGTPRGSLQRRVPAVPMRRSVRLSRVGCSESVWDRLSLSSSSGLHRSHRERRSRQPGSGHLSGRNRQACFPNRDELKRPTYKGWRSLALARSTKNTDAVQNLYNHPQNHPINPYQSPRKCSKKGGVMRESLTFISFLAVIHSGTFSNCYTTLV